MEDIVKCSECKFFVPYDEKCGICTNFVRACSKYVPAIYPGYYRNEDYCALGERKDDR